ncbi:MULTISPECIES: hypothetical protein [unclassified Mesorhizobium]|uniref:hypothetical protein n=1 Tax=unclassified Mesorhizobium TaxID=325217 RepID=UPI001126AA85|nr:MULTISPECIES: hypothetical protein [unclassified Mesorhizobium]MBZ9703259.1 hypothetical protein [Mesorhizobium sp. CO1-1-3]MBZ9947110.1 hypothetical protein [Mesorhizobium sp. BR1-1-11]TPJ06667.1 hypothetical protein FJ428_10655 [Mesorhizobium sp. B2-8-1]
MDLIAQMRPVMHEDQERYMIYPGKDPRVVQTLRKVLRGLSHHHGIRSAVRDGEVFVDVLKVPVPLDVIDRMISAYAEPDILDYRYAVVDDTPGIESAWSLRFYERTVFVGIIFASAQARERFEAGDLGRVGTDITCPVAQNR